MKFSTTLPKALLDGPCFLVFPVVEGDGFGIIADMDHAVAEIRLFAELLEIQEDELLPEPEGDKGPQGCINEKHAHQHFGDAPENRRKSDQLADGRQDDGKKAQTGDGEVFDVPG